MILFFLILFFPICAPQLCGIWNPHRCGISVAGYLAAVAAVVAGGLWSSVWTWRHRTARAHILSILLIAWGLMLGAIDVLPRIGYAKQALTWGCVAPAPATPQQQTPAPTNPAQGPQAKVPN